MALTRPAEKKWIFKQPPEPFMPTPCSGAYIGPSGTGKSTTLISLLLGPYKTIYERVFVFSPSVEIDSAWDPVKEHAKHLKGSGFFSEWDEKALWQILNEQRDTIKDLKKKQWQKALPQVLVIIDDFADRSDIMHNAGSILTSLFIRGRHFGCSTWLSSQKLTAISLVARVNFKFLCVWRLRNQKEIEAIIEELSALYPKDILLDMYNLAVSDQDFSWWYILLTAKSKDNMFHIRFEKKLLVK